MRDEVDAVPPVGVEHQYGRNFRLYATATAVSVVGDRVAGIALVFLVIHLSRSFAPGVALFYVSRVLPILLGGLLVGAFVDLLDRRLILVSCALTMAAVVAAIPALGTISPWTLYPAVFVLSALNLLYTTTALATLPDVVPAELLTRANSILSTINTSADVAYALGGALVFWLKYQAPFYIDAVTFIFAAGMLAGMRIPRRRVVAQERREPVLWRIRQGIRYLLGQTFLKWSTMAFAVAPFAGGAVLVLSPLYAQSTLASSPALFGPLRNGAFRFSVLEVCLGLGAVLGSAIVPRLAARQPRGRLFGLGLAGLGASQACLAFTSNMYVACGLIFVGGAFNSMFVITGTTLVQTLTPTEVRGRVVATRFTVINGALALGSAAGGLLLLKLPYWTLWLSLGGIEVVASLFIWLRRDVRSQR